MSSEGPGEIPSTLSQKDTLYPMGRSPHQCHCHCQCPRGGQTQLVLRPTPLGWPLYQNRASKWVTIYGETPRNWS